MRTHEKFINAWQSLQWWVSFHKSSIWLVPTKEDYKLSVIRPLPEDLPVGTAANKYDTYLKIIETVRAK